MDTGNLSQAMPGNQEPNTFSLPEWDFDEPETQQSKGSLLSRGRSGARTCGWLPLTKRSPMQATNQRSEIQAQQLFDERLRLVKGQVNFAMQVFVLAVELGTEATIEQAPGRFGDVADDSNQEASLLLRIDAAPGWWRETRLAMCWDLFGRGFD